MEQVIEKLRNLPEARQESFARFLLTELDTDAAWERTTALHSDRAEQFAREVLAADAGGETEALDPDQL